MCHEALRLKVFPNIINEQNEVIKSLYEEMKYMKIQSVLDTICACERGIDNIGIFHKVRQIYIEEYKYSKENELDDWIHSSKIKSPWELYNFSKLEDRKKFKKEIFLYILENISYMKPSNSGEFIEYDEEHDIFIE